MHCLYLKWAGIVPCFVRCEPFPDPALVILLDPEKALDSVRLWLPIDGCVVSGAEEQQVRLPIAIAPWGGLFRARCAILGMADDVGYLADCRSGLLAGGALDKGPAAIGERTQSPRLDPNESVDPRTWSQVTTSDVTWYDTF